jgi:hypothetical protein
LRARNGLSASAAQNSAALPMVTPAIGLHVRLPLALRPNSGALGLQQHAIDFRLARRCSRGRRAGGPTTTAALAAAGTAATPQQQQRHRPGASAACLHARAHCRQGVLACYEMCCALCEPQAAVPNRALPAPLALQAAPSAAP